MKLIMIICLLILTSSCNKFYQGYYKSPLKPFPLYLKNLPQGNDSFSKGYREGCINIVGQSGSGLLRIYDKSKDPQMLSDDLYNQAYRLAERQCGAFIDNEVIL